MWVSNSQTGTNYLTSPMFAKYSINLEGFREVAFSVSSVAGEAPTLLLLTNVPNPEKNYLIDSATSGKPIAKYDIKGIGDYLYVDRLGEFRKIVRINYSDKIINLSELPYNETFIEIEEPFSEVLTNEDLYFISGMGGTIIPLGVTYLSERDYLGGITDSMLHDKISSSGILLFKSEGALVGDFK